MLFWYQFTLIPPVPYLWSITTIRRYGIPHWLVDVLGKHTAAGEYWRVCRWHYCCRYCAQPHHSHCSRCEVLHNKWENQFVVFWRHGDSTIISVVCLVPIWREEDNDEVGRSWQKLQVSKTLFILKESLTRHLWTLKSGWMKIYIIVQEYSIGLIREFN